MKKWMKLLALVLAAAMLLPSAALAAETDGEEDGPKVVMRWLDWDDQGHCYASDDVLDADSGGDDGMGYNPARGDHLIFFVQDGNKKTPVLPTGDDNLTVIKVDEEGIQDGAKQSDYYVRLEMKAFKDGELTVKYQGKDLTFPVIAELPDAGYYSAPEAKPENLLVDGTDPAALTDLTAYFIVTANDEDNGRHMTDVKKGTNGTPSRWELEEAGEGVWKITLKADQDWVGVNLDITFLDVEGSTYTEDRGIGFAVDYGPELWLRWLDRNDEVGLYLPEEAEAYGGFQPHPYDDFVNVIFYTCDYNDKGEQTLTPVLPEDLKGSEGVTITDVSDQSADELAKYFVNVKVADWEKNYTITSGDYTMRFDSNLPDFGLYTKPELTTDSYLDGWRFSPVDTNETVYIGSYIPEGDDRFLADLKLGEFENSDQFTLEKYDDAFYKMTRKSLEVSDTDIRFEGTWGWPDGNTEPFDAGMWTGPWPVTFISEKPYADSMESDVFYDDVKDILSNSITLKAGETKTVYLGYTYYTDFWGGWLMLPRIPIDYAATDGLKLETVAEAGYPVKYTISSDTPGEYQIGRARSTEWSAYDKDGKDITDSLAAQEIFPEYVYETGEWALFDYSGEEPVPYEFDGRLAFETGEVNTDWYTVTVTVEPDTLPFTDVAEDAWYQKAVSYVNSKKYMTGTTAVKFDPAGQVTGAQFAQILYNKENKPTAAEGAAFQGVAEQWYAPAVLWAAGKGLVTDTGDTAIVPEASLTRQQIAVILYNYMGKPEAEADMTAFADADQISAWAQAAMEWAVSAKVFNGSKDGAALKLNPTNTISRAEVATVLMNYFG